MASDLKKNSAPSGIRAKILPYLGMALGGVFCFLVFRRIDWEKIAVLFSQMRWGFFYLSLMALFLLYGCYAWRWRVLLQALTGLRIPIRELNELCILGAYSSIVAPGAGEVVKAFLLKKNYSIAYESSVLAAFFEKIYSLFWFLCLVFFIFQLRPGYLPQVLKEYWLPIAALSIVFMLFFRPILLAICRIVHRIFQWLGWSGALQLDRLAASEKLFRWRTQLFFHIGMGLRVFLECLFFWFMLESLRIQIPLDSLLAVRLLVNLLTMIPIAPSNIGTLELATVLLLGFCRVPSESALAIVLLERLLSLGLLIPCGVLLWHRYFNKLQSPRSLRV